MAKQTVIGQTGTTVLSDELLQYQRSMARTVRYQYEKMETLQSGFIAWVCGPFHSALYGACGFGTTKRLAKVALQCNLANNKGYLGCMLFSDVDESDTVGLVCERLLDENETARPTTLSVLCGTAGQ